MGFEPQTIRNFVKNWILTLDYKSEFGPFWTHCALVGVGIARAGLKAGKDEVVPVGEFEPSLEQCSSSSELPKLSIFSNSTPFSLYREKH